MYVKTKFLNNANFVSNSSGLFADNLSNVIVLNTNK